MDPFARIIKRLVVSFGRGPFIELGGEIGLWFVSDRARVLRESGTVIEAVHDVFVGEVGRRTDFLGLAEAPDLVWESGEGLFFEKGQLVTFYEVCGFEGLGVAESGHLVEVLGQTVRAFVSFGELEVQVFDASVSDIRFRVVFWG